MQATRERILNIMKERHQTTVDELSRELGLTAVTVRHHLEILRGEGMIAPPMLRRRKAPGRPKYVYTLTEKASSFFPKRYQYLATMLLREMRAEMPAEKVEQVMRRIGQGIALQAGVSDKDLGDRLVTTVDFLNQQGYLASLQEEKGDYLLHISNCPYEWVANQDQKVCAIDFAMLSELLGLSPERISWMARGDAECCYRIHPAD